MTRSVLITGGTGALGGAVTRRFLEDGHRVATTCHSDAESEKLLASLGPLGDKLELIRTDVTDESSVDAAVDRARQRLGRVEALVHLVGAWHGGETVAEHSVETWDRLLRLNLTSAFLCCRAVLPEMMKTGWGRIVLVSSRAARSGREGQVAYAVAKEGVAVLADVIAEECRGANVTANAVAPSVLDTPANRAAMPSADFTHWVAPERLAAVTAFLVSEEACELRGAWLPVFGSV